MIESCCQIGARGELAGITTVPKGDARRIANLMVSAGLVPKFGPYRLYAELARRLAQSGFRTLRFDLGDIGDSRQAQAGQPLEVRTRLEIDAAISHLERSFDIDGVVLTGLCSGAEDSFRHAHSDTRVVAIVLIDPFAYRTPGWIWRNAWQRFVRRSMRLLGWYQPLKYGGGFGGGQSAARPRLNYKHMGHAESSRILADLIERGVRIHFIYTGGASDSFNHRSQLQAMFSGIDFRGLVTVDHFPHIDHTQPLQGERDSLIETIVRHLELGRSSPRAALGSTPNRP